MERTNKTTKHDFAVFKKEAEKWIKRFGLTDWKIKIEHRDTEDQSIAPSLAWFAADAEACIASANLSLDWGKKDGITENELRRCALHEILHIVFSWLSIYAASRYVPKDCFELEEHKVIRKFESLFYDRPTKS